LALFEGATGTFVNGDQAFPLDITTEYFRVINEVASGNMEADAAAAAMQTFIGNRG
jgi:raffinose/stachyose/melibiose transport system substrate-binding protein